MLRPPCALCLASVLFDAVAIACPWLLQATFAVHRALNGALNVPSAFYALSLLLLPKLYMYVRWC